MVSQVHIGEEGTSSGEICINSPNGGGMEVLSGQDGGDYDSGAGKSLCSPLCYSADQSTNSLLLCSKVVCACVDDDADGPVSTDVKDMRKQAMDFYSALYTAEPCAFTVLHSFFKDSNDWTLNPELS
ncbi:hypothetical protein SRHO_G00008650 [Serrasalmus rhombeus]